MPKKAKAKPPAQDLDEREVLRLSYINICRNLAEPLRQFLDHPFTPREYAVKISNLIGDIFNDSRIASEATDGEFAADHLLQIARGHENLNQPDWAKPLGFYITQALEDERTPVDLHNGLVDACDLVMEPFVGSAADDVRRRFVDCLTKTIAGTTE